MFLSISIHHCILSFNDKVKEDPRIEKVILPLRDGLTMIWKK